MSAVALAPPDELQLWDERAPRKPVAPHRVHAQAATRDGQRAASLEDLVVGTWEALVARAPAACPSCGAELRARWSAGAGIVGGHCEACGTDVS